MSDTKTNGAAPTPGAATITDKKVEALEKLVADLSTKLETATATIEKLAAKDNSSVKIGEAPKAKDKPVILKVGDKTYETAYRNLNVIGEGGVLKPVDLTKCSQKELKEFYDEDPAMFTQVK